MKQVFKKCMGWCGSHATDIQFALGMALHATSLVFAWNDVPKCKQDLEAERLRLMSDENGAIPVDAPKVKLGIIPVTRIAMKNCWKTILCESLADICLISSKVGDKRTQIALALANEASQAALAGYMETAAKEIGEEKVKEIAQKATAEKIENLPAPEEKDIIRTGFGEDLIYDDFSGRWFYGNVSDIYNAETIFKNRLLDESYMTVNEYYDILKLPHCKAGERAFFECYDGKLPEFFYTTAQAPRTENGLNGRPALVIIFDSTKLRMK